MSISRTPGAETHRPTRQPTSRETPGLRLRLASWRRACLVPLALVGCADEGPAPFEADAGDVVGDGEVLSRAVSTRRLGTMPTDQASGATGAVTFSLAPATTSFFVTVRTDADVLLAVTSLGTTPAESALTPVDWPEVETNTGRTCWTCAWPSHLDRRAASLSSSVVSAAGLSGGPWTVAAITRSPMLRSAPESVVDVEFWLTEVSELDTAAWLALDVVVIAGETVGADAVGDWLDEASIALAPARIVVRGVATHQRSARVRDDGAGGLAGVPAIDDGRDVVTVVFADALESPEGDAALAISGGLPGPWPSASESAATVVVDVPRALAAGVAPGVLLAHELGHQLGLQHVIERGAAPGGIGEDRLDDTSFDDSNNLMFWDVRVGGRALSDGQIRALRSHPRLVPIP